jgi:hypothetical protein
MVGNVDSCGSWHDPVVHTALRRSTDDGVLEACIPRQLSQHIRPHQSRAYRATFAEFRFQLLVVQPLDIDLEIGGVIVGLEGDVPFSIGGRSPEVC